MAEINKLSVAKVLDKLRSNDAKDNRSKLDQLDDEIKAVDEEVQRLRAQRSRLKRGRRTGAINSDGQP
jgi:hypothetical protein